MTAPVVVTPLQMKMYKAPQQLLVCSFHGIITSTSIFIAGFALPHLISFFCDCKGQGVGYFSLQRAVFRPPFFFSLLLTCLI